MSQTFDKWNPVPPGLELFWGIVAQSGKVIALRLGSESIARQICDEHNCRADDFVEGRIENLADECAAAYIQTRTNVPMDSEKYRALVRSFTTFYKRAHQAQKNFSLIFDDWRNAQNRSIYQTAQGIELSSGVFHGGSTFGIEIELSPEDQADLEHALAEGYMPIFRVSL